MLRQNGRILYSAIIEQAGGAFEDAKFSPIAVEGNKAKTHVSWCTSHETFLCQHVTTSVEEKEPTWRGTLTPAPKRQKTMLRRKGMMLTRSTPRWAAFARRGDIPAFYAGKSRDNFCPFGVEVFSPSGDFWTKETRA